MILAYDGSRHARNAIAQAAALLAERHAVVLTIWLSFRGPAPAARLALPDDVIEAGVAGLDADAEEAARGLAMEGTALAHDLGLEAQPLVERGDAGVAGAIVRVAEERGAPLIALGPRGRSEIGSLLLGSVAYSVLHQARRPVLVAADAASERTPASGPVVLCYDGSDNSRRAIEHAGRLLAPAPVLVAHYWEPIERATSLSAAAHPSVLPELEMVVAGLEAEARADARRIAEEGTEVAREVGLDGEAAPVSGHDGAWPALLRFAESRDARALVVGSRGRSQATSLVLGSVSHALVHRSGRPVLVVPPG